jgi:Flp pilus assembly protein TadD
MLDEAAILFSEVLRLEPNNLEGHRDLGVAFARQGKLNEAIRQFAEAVRLDPTRPELRFNLGLALLDAGRSDEATIQFQEILLRNPNDTSTHYRLATALMRQHDSKGAVAHFREAVRLSPEFSDALTELAWILATAPDSELRAGEEAVQLARQACNLTEYKQPRTVAALAAAYAETARFPDAVATAKRARDLAVAGGQQDVIATAESLLKVSEAGHPFRQVL